MKKTALFILFILFFCTITTFAQSLLWKISGNDIKNPSYLYGTFHIQDNRVFCFDKTVVHAFNHCEAFAAEFLLDEVDPNSLSSKILMQDTLLSDLLSPEQYHTIDLFFQTIGMPIQTIANIKPLFISLTIEQLDSDTHNSEEEALDAFFLHKARDKGKICFGIESYEDQLKAIDRISLKEQAELLYQTITQPNTSQDDYTQLLDYYLQFNIDKMNELTRDPRLPKNFYQVLVNDRNKKMVEKFLEIATKHTLFCAIGAGHFGGEEGILHLLELKGYTVEAIPFRWSKRKQM